MKLFTRYSVINLLVMVVIFLVSSIVIYLLVQVILIHEMDADLSGIEGKVKAYVERYNALPGGHPLDEEKISFEDAGPQKPSRNSVSVQLYSDREMKMHNFRQLVFPLWFGRSWQKVVVAKPIEGMHHLSRALITISLITILFTILISIALNSLLLRRLWKPFYNSMAIMRNFQLGRTNSLYFPATKIAEFAFMNESLRLATQKAEQDYLVLKEFTENASHEMQTPLSIIRSKLDMLIQEKGLSEKQGELVSAAYGSVKRLSRLNHSLLLLAKIENQQFDNMQDIDLKSKVEEKIQQFQELWHSRQIKADYVLQDSCVHISAHLLDILLNNLFSNASNHNVVSGDIYIQLEKNSLAISNTGNSGPLDEKKLFTRFYKKSINSNSNGLGLSIIKQISKVSHITTTYEFKNSRHLFSLTWL